MSTIISDDANAKNRLNDNVNPDQTASTKRLSQQNGFLANVSATGVEMEDASVIKYQEVKVSDIIGNY